MNKKHIAPIKANIQPERLYLTNDINELIRSTTGTGMNHYSAIIERLVKEKVIELNLFYTDAYSHYGSTPF